MTELTEWIVLLIAFAMISLSSRQIGQYFLRARLPLITGFLFAGMLAGPFVLNFISNDAIDRLLFIEETSLAFIAFAAGSELYIKALRSNLKSIFWVVLGNSLAIPLGGSVAVYLLSDFIPFMQGQPASHRVAIAILAGAILLARSPSSAIAIVNELRAKGGFTRTTLGVTMVTDVLVIVIFAINLEVADVLLTNAGFSVGFLLLLVGEIALALTLGYGVGRLLQLILGTRLHSQVKSGLILLLGYGVFAGSAYARHWTAVNLSFEILLEPLLMCMVGSFMVTNYSPYRDEFSRILEDLSPAVYIIFFTLTGASLALDVLAATWVVALMLFVVRLVGLFIGSYLGGMVAGDPAAHNRVSWMAYVTQAGVGLGLAKEVAVIFPEFGGEFATEIISVIVISQILGPPLHKWAIHRMKEAHVRADTAVFDGVRDVLIFGFDHQAMALARQLQTHNWQVRFGCLDSAILPELADSDLQVTIMPEINEAELDALSAGSADAIVTLLSDAENLRICELAYEHYGTKTVVARVTEWANLEQFQELGVLIVEPGTAMVSLLEQFVRSPVAASLLLGQAVEQEVVEIEVRDSDLHGIALRDLRLPLDTLILSVYRDGQSIISHGYTQLALGDKVTIVGTPESLAEVTLRFDKA